MNTTQKVIKYLAIAFGIFLSVTIISSVIFGVACFLNILDNNKSIEYNDSNVKISDKHYEKEFGIDEIRNLSIELNISKLYIVKGNQLGIKADNIYEGFSADVQNGELIISEDINLDKKLFKSNRTSIVTLYIPEKFEFDSVTIKSGVGDINIEELNSKKIDATFGVGDFNAQNINSENTVFKGGVGDLNISNSDLGKIEYKAGIGDSDIECKLSDNSKIESGVGNITLKLLGSEESYYFDVEAGMGDITLNDNKIKNGNFGDKEAKEVKIKGGIGNIKINY